MSIVKKLLLWFTLLKFDCFLGFYMVLKKSVHKVRSSLATFLFAQRELPIIARDYPRKRLEQLCPFTVARTDNEYIQLIQHLQLISCSSHFEILSRSLMEHLNLLGFTKIDSDPRLTDLRKLCKELRDAFGHIAKNDLIPKWSKIDPQTLSIKVPLTNIKEGYILDPHSKFSYVITIKTTKNQEILFTNNFVRKSVILSYHVLEILKKQKTTTLDKYLNRIPALELLPQEKIPF